nr:hypothetical protein IUWQDXFC_IUWQDXFC_CDS_0010 [Microvirus sp.]
MINYNLVQKCQSIDDQHYMLEDIYAEIAVLQSDIEFIDKTLCSNQTSAYSRSVHAMFAQCYRNIARIIEYDKTGKYSNQYYKMYEQENRKN